MDIWMSHTKWDCAFSSATLPTQLMFMMYLWARLRITRIYFSFLDIFLLFMIISFFVRIFLCLFNPTKKFTFASFQYIVMFFFYILSIVYNLKRSVNFLYERKTSGVTSTNGKCEARKRGILCEIFEMM